MFKGQGSLSDYIDAIISILESIVQHKELLKEFSNQVIKYILPSLIDNIDSNNSDLRVQSLKVLSEISCLFYNNTDVADGELKKKLRSFIESHFIDL
jgi:hypothetical protein